MRNRILVAATGLLCSLAVMALAQQAAPAPATAPAFRYAPQLSKGDVFWYAVTKEDTHTGPGAEPPTKVGYTVQLTVADVAENGSALVWRVDHIKILEAADTGPQVQALAAAGNGVSLKFGMTPAGDLTPVTNVEESELATAKIIDMASAGKPEADRRKIHDNFAAGDTPALRATMSKALLLEPSILLAGGGTDFTAAGTSRRSEMGNPFGGAPLMGTTRCVLARTLPNGDVEVRMETRGDPDLGKTMAQSLQKADADAGRKSDVPSDVQLELIQTWDMILKNGRTLPATLRFERAIKVDTGADKESQDTVYVFEQLVGDATRPVK